MALSHQASSCDLSVLAAPFACAGADCHLPATPPTLLQNDVEQFYIRSGYLLPNYHDFYWLGLSTQRNPPNFGWTDGAFKPKQLSCE